MPEDEELSQFDVAKRLAVAGSAGLAAHELGLAGAERMLGLKRVSHGTSNAAADAIRRQGFKTSFGGSPLAGGAAIGNEAFVRNSKNKIHVASGFGGDVIARAHAALTEAKTRNPSLSHEDAMKAYLKGAVTPFGGGTVVRAAVPYEDFLRKFEVDPDYGGVSRAFRTSHNIGADRVSKGALGLLDMIRMRPKNLGAFVKAHPQRFIAGVGLTGLGAAAAYGGYRTLSPVVKSMLASRSPQLSPGDTDTLEGAKLSNLRALRNETADDAVKMAHYTFKSAAASTYYNAMTALKPPSRQNYG